MDFSKMSKEELIEYIKSLDEQTNGKYGLVWDKEKEPEKIVVECDKKIPILKEIKKKAINNGGQNNILIEGDNFHALSVLNYTHKEAIDVIYIDPPYNTGNKDFIYNDKFVDMEDGYRHSKWLNFMEKRLKLSRELLKSSGSIMISVDDNEQAQLKILCDKIFGDSNYVGSFIINAAPNGRDYGAMAKQHEYCLFYAKDLKELFFNKIKDEEKKFSYSDQIGGFNIHPLYNSNVAFTVDNRPNLFYPFYVNPLKQSDGFYEISLKQKKGYIEVYPPVSVKGDAQFVWRWGKSRAEEYLNKEIIGHKVNDEFRIVQKMRHSEKLIRSLLVDSKYATRRGTAELENIMGQKSFAYPKPLELMKLLLEATCTVDAIVLDFFAGSGTTGQAVLELNAEDGGNRKFILCTNNENNICEDVTYPRIKTIITGKREDKSKYSDGLVGSLQYFKTDFVDNVGTKDQLYYDLTEKCIPMLCVKGDTFIPYKSTEEYAVYTNDDKSMYSCVYFDVLGQKYKEFLKEVKKIKEPKLLYIFNLGDYIDLSDLKEIDNYSVESIPYKIIELYKKIVKMSKGE